MPLVSLLVALVVLGLVLYLMQLIPMDARIKQIINAIAIAFVVIWCIKLLLGAGGVEIP
jgi:hypothetical protein